MQIVEAAGLGGLFTDNRRVGRYAREQAVAAPRTCSRSSSCSSRAAQTSIRQRCVAIEDSVWGLESARGAGLRCVGVTTSYPAAELTAAELVAVD